MSQRRRPVLKFRERGLFMNSFGNQYDPKPKKVWIPHTKIRQATKNLRNLCRTVKLSQSDLDMAAEQLDRLNRLASEDPNPEYIRYSLMWGALENHRDTGVAFVEMLKYWLDHFETERAAVYPAQIAGTAGISKQSSEEKTDGIESGVGQA